MKAILLKTWRYTMLVAFRRSYLDRLRHTGFLFPNSLTTKQLYVWFFSGQEQLERMQTPKAKAAMKRAFDASPKELGKAAVEGARKH
jgi:hypothetical protein